MTEKNLNKKIIEFVHLIGKSGIKITKIVLFGSYAKRNNNRNSDIDICVVSSNFGQDTTKDMAFLISKAREIDYRIEPIPYTPKQLKNMNDPLAYEITKFGRTIYSIN
jgi:predicted nucleotidyltransferase